MTGADIWSWHALAAIREAWLWLGAQNELAQPMVVILIAWGLPRLFRLSPALHDGWWEPATAWAVLQLSYIVGPELALRLRKAVQTIPSIAIGAALAVLVSGGDVGEALYVQLYALLAPIAHDLAKQYRGGPLGGTGGAS